MLTITINRRILILWNFVIVIFLDERSFASSACGTLSKSLSTLNLLTYFVVEKKTGTENKQTMRCAIEKMKKQNKWLYRLCNLFSRVQYSDNNIFKVKMMEQICFSFNSPFLLQLSLLIGALLLVHGGGGGSFCSLTFKIIRGHYIWSSTVRIGPRPLELVRGY